MCCCNTRTHRVSRVLFMYVSERFFFCFIETRGFFSIHLRRRVSSRRNAVNQRQCNFTTSILIAAVPSPPHRPRRDYQISSCRPCRRRRRRRHTNTRPYPYAGPQHVLPRRYHHARACVQYYLLCTSHCPVCARARYNIVDVSIKTGALPLIHN